MSEKPTIAALRAWLKSCPLTDWVLAKDPENRAALKAQRLAEAEKRTLQEEYFAHAEKAMEKLRAAKENAATLSNEGAAKKAKFQLQEGEGTLEEQLNDNLDQLEKMEPVAQITGKEVAYGETPKENTDNIFKYFESIGGKVERTGFGTVELGKKGAKATVRHGNGPVKQSAIAAVPEVIQNGKQIGYAENWKGRGCNTYVFAAPVTIGGTEIYEAVIVNAYGNTKQGNKFYVHEVCGTDGNLLVLDDNGQIKQKQESADTVLKTEEGTERPGFPAKSSIAQKNAESKESDAPVKKNVRMQIAEADEAERLRTEQEALSEQKKALKEERTAWLESAEVKAIEAKKKSMGTFSAQAREYRSSEEYQNYLAKRKDYNSRLAQLEEQSAALCDRMREAGERLQARVDAKAKDRQLAYNAEAEKHGGKAEYRRQLAKERFGVTEDFKKAGYILPDGEMLNFAQSERTRDMDHREILSVFGQAEVKTGTEALNEFLLDGNVRVMAEGPGVDISADAEPTALQLEQIRKMVDELSGERGQFILDISTADGRVAASKEYSGHVNADKVVREIREYYKTGELAQESELAKPASGPDTGPAFDYRCDAPYIVAAFQQAYGIDLTQEKMHWFRFRALFAALPEDTLMARIINWRALDLADYEGSMREHYAELKERFALPAGLRGGAAVAQTVAEHDAAFLARFRR